MNQLYPAGTKKYLAWSRWKKPIELVYTCGLDDVWAWRDCFGGIYALAEAADSVDSEVRCGIGFMSLPQDHPLTDACRPHDYKTESPVYQAYHNMREAQLDFVRDAELANPGKWYNPIITGLAGMFTMFFWENKATRS